MLFIVFFFFQSGGERRNWMDGEVCGSEHSSSTQTKRHYINWHLLCVCVSWSVDPWEISRGGFYCSGCIYPSFLSYTKAPALKDRRVLMCKWTVLYIHVNLFFKVHIKWKTVCFDSEFSCIADAHLGAKLSVQQD